MATYLKGLLSGWEQLDAGDMLWVAGTDRLPHGIEDSAAVKKVVLVSRGAVPGRIAQQIALPLIARRFRPDVLLTTDPALPLLLRSVSAVATVHDVRHLEAPAELSPIQRTYRKVAWGQGLRRADAVVANSNATADAVRRWYPEAAARIQTVYLGSDHAETWLRSTSTEPHAVAFAHIAIKQPEVSIRVWGELRRRHQGFVHQLQLIGVHPSQRRRLEALVRESGAGGLVVLREPLIAAELEHVFATASLLLMPSTLEGFGLAMVEAMRLGVPVVASRIPSLVEVGGDGALYAGAHRDDEFVERCETALFEPPARQELIQRGRERAAGFTWRRTAEQTRDITLQVVESATRWRAR